MSDKLNDTIQPPYPGLCSECQTGVLRLKLVTYFTWLDDELVSAPNFPAWVCDVCGRREYDPRAVLRLNTILTHEGGARQPRSRRRPSAPHADTLPPT
jgi:YgiT-type zinc finger domain-containing protein